MPTKKGSVSPGVKRGNTAMKKMEFDNILSALKDKCSDLIENDAKFHESVEAVNEHLQSESSDVVGEDKIAVKVIALMLPVLEVLISSKQDGIIIEHDKAINKLQAEVRNNAYKTDLLNQYTRRENLRISNVPEAEGEVLSDVLIEIASSINVTIKHENINTVHRLGVKRAGKSRQIIARFVHREPRFLMLKNRSDLRKTEKF